MCCARSYSYRGFDRFLIAARSVCCTQFCRFVKYINWHTRKYIFLMVACIGNNISNHFTRVVKCTQTHKENAQAFIIHPLKLLPHVTRSIDAWR